MKFDDAVWGVLIAALGAVLLVYVQGFPTIPGQHVGAGLFPGFVGAGLAGCGLVLLGRGLRARRADGGRQAWMHMPAWAGSPRHAAAFGVLVAVNLLYLLAVDRLGFVLTGFVYLAATMSALGVRPSRALPLAVALTLAIHFCFYKLLRVPLPWGLLQPLAW